MADLDLKMRPRFAVDVQCGVATLVETLQKRIEEAAPALEGSFSPEHCVLRLPAERRSFFSPELDLTFEPLEAEAGEPSPALRVRCLFSPRPAVWTGFAFVYAVLATVTLASSLYGLSQLTLGHAPEAFVVSLAALLLLVGTYGASFIGQGLAATQMYEIRSYLDDCLERAEAVARRTPRTSFDSARL